MTDATLTRAGASGRSTAQLRKSLKRRHARERRFKLYGVLAIAIAIGFLALLLGRIIEQGHTAFWTHTVADRGLSGPRAHRPGLSRRDQFRPVDRRAAAGAPGRSG